MKKRSAFLKLAALVLLMLAVLIGPPNAWTANFEPDEVVTSLVVRVKTSSDWWAGTDDDVYFSVKEGIEWQLDTPWVDDFERGSQRDYSLDPHGIRVQDIQRIRIRKSPDGLAGGWKLGWIIVFVNGKLLYDSGTIERWLEDDHRVWTAPDWTPITWPPLQVESTFLADGTANQDYTSTVTGSGGKTPYTWSVSVVSNPGIWSQGPSASVLNSTQGRITGRSRGEGTSTLRITVRDARGVEASRELTVRFITTLPPPTIASFTPTSGWPPAPSWAIPTGTRVTIRGSNFDSRAAANNIVRFNGRLAPIESVSPTQIIATVPTGATTGPISVQTPFGTATSTGNFRVHTYGYRGTHGFQFSNYSTDDLSWDIYRDLFGSSQVEYTVPLIGPVPKPLAGLFYLLAFKDVAEGGNCHGFTLSSLRFQKGDALLEQYPPKTSTTVYGLDGSSGPSSKLNRLINMNQGAQLGLDALWHFLRNNRSGNPTQLLNEVRSALGTSDPRMISITKSLTEGHMLLPYAVEDLSGDISLIRVYDPNKPFRSTETDDNNSAITINRRTNTWSYPFSSTETWSGPWFTSIPYSKYPLRPRLITNEADLALLIVIFGDAATKQLSDDTGHTFFDAKGQLNTDPTTKLDNVMKVIPLAGKEGFPDMFFVAAHEKLRTFPKLNMEVSSKQLAEGNYITALFTKDLAYAFSNITAMPQLLDRFRLDPNERKIEFTGASDKGDVWIDVIHRVQGDQEALERTISLGNVKIPAGDTFVLFADPTRSSVNLRNSGEHQLEFNLMVEDVNSNGSDRKFVGRLQVAPRGTAVMSFTPAVTTFALDKDGDGIADQVQQLVPKQLPPRALLGDANGDGQVSPVDAAVVLRFAVGKATPDEGQRLRSDVAPRQGTADRLVGDGKITVEDALVILKAVVGLEPPLGTTLDPYERPRTFPRLATPLPKSYVDDAGPLVRLPTVDINTLLPPSSNLPVITPIVDISIFKPEPIIELPPIVLEPRG